MRVTNNGAMTATGNNKPTFSKAIMSDSIQNLIKKSVPDSRSAARLTGTLVSVVATNPQLQNCTPATVIAAAVHGEGMGLAIGQGFYIVPYGNTAKFMLGYKGMLQLAIATGLFADIDCVAVREGEIVGRDPKTKRHIFDFSRYTEEEESEHEIIGYMAYAELKDGFYRYEYISMKELLRRADRFSAAFSIDRYNKLIEGKLSAAEAEKLKKSSPWYDIGGNQETMCKKTVLRSLLTSGYLPIASDTLTQALKEDAADDEGIILDAPSDNKSNIIPVDDAVVVDAENNTDDKNVEDEFFE